MVGPFLNSHPVRLNFRLSPLPVGIESESTEMLFPDNGVTPEVFDSDSQGTTNVVLVKISER